MEDEMRDFEKLNTKLSGLPFSDYAFVDTAFGGPAKRNNVIRMNDIAVPASTFDCYASMFRFDHNYKKLCDSTGSVRGANSLLCYADYLSFDIDATDLNQAIVSARQLIINIDFLDTVFADHLVFFFSGAKGFHIGIPSQFFGAVPSTKLPQIFKSLAKSIARDSRIDLSVYEKNRLWRIPNTLNSKSGLYKIPLTFEELSTWGIERIKKLARQPQGEAYIPLTYEGQFEPHPVLVDFYEKAIEEIRRPSIDTKVTDNYLDRHALHRPCFQKLLKGVPKGQRNEAAIRLTVAYRKRGDSLKQTLSELQIWNLRNEQPMEEHELENTCNSAFSGQYDYGCNDHLLASLCQENCPFQKSPKGKKDKPETTPVSSAALSDGSLAELVYNPDRWPKPVFAHFPPPNDGSVGGVGSVRFSEVILTKSGLMAPLRTDDIIQTNAVRFPTGVSEYNTEAALVAEIDRFIREYLSVSEPFHTIAKYYVLFTWVYDRFSEVPYLRVLGDYGTGKSRFLMTVGSLCYKPSFMMGATSTASIFRLQHMVGGTLIMDEADVNKSDESHLLIKLLNAGYQKTFPLFRCDVKNNKRIGLVCFNVFGPKLIATRKNFGDPALESRCLTEHMDGKLRGNIPLNITPDFWDKACAIRNKCLMWRFRNYHSVPRHCITLPPDIHPRLAQILTPLASIIEDNAAVEQLTALMMSKDAELREDQLETPEGLVARVIIELEEAEGHRKFSIKQVTEKVNESIEQDRYKMTNQKVGKITSKVLGLPKVRLSGGSHVALDSPDAARTLKYLRGKYGL